MSISTSSAQSPHRWRFYRAGGLDLVRLETADDLRHLGQLDQKLWTALACPVKGLEFDEKTLALIDHDRDGRVRAPELIATVDWVCSVLADPASIVAGRDAVTIANITDATIRDSATEILASLGKSDATTIGCEDVADTARIFAQTRFNGDGVVTAQSAGDDAATARVITEIIASAGGVTDRSGAPGVDRATLGSFHAALAAYDTWVAAGDANPAIKPAGENTGAAAAAIAAVRAKLDDYFSRCRVAAFDARALAAVNRQENEYLALAAHDLSVTAEEMAGFPIAHVAAGRPLPLREGVNPAWGQAMETFARAAVDPLLGAGKTSLTEAEWKALKQQIEPYEAWQATKAGTMVEPLGRARVRELLAGPAQAAITALIEKDSRLSAHFAAIGDVAKLTRLHRDLYRLLMNFVSFTDLYDPRRPAIFQNGTLYLDARSCNLCIRVDAPNPLAAMSKIYIAYCTCTRPGSAPMTIAACFTQGDSDYLFVGRHGLFYDRQGRDWDAVITSLVDNPISIHQAFWSPYKKFVRMIEEQAAKRAAAADAESTNRLAAAAEKSVNLDKAKPAEPPKKVDVGTVAAIGVAFGALTTAFGYFLGFFKGMPGWQVPLVFLAVLLIISLPSMIIAALKLRQRTIGPILDGNGWAVNGRVKVNIPFGTSLTERARLPAGSQRSLDDPYAEKKTPWKTYVVLALLIAAAVWIRWDHNRHDGFYFWQTRPVSDAPAVEIDITTDPDGTTTTTPPPAPASGPAAAP